MDFCWADHISATQYLGDRPTFFYGSTNDKLFKGNKFPIIIL